MRHLNRMRLGLIGLLVAFMTLLTAGPALAYDAYDARVGNQTPSGALITAAFADKASGGVLVSFNIASPNGFQGEWVGHERYEPRELHIKNGWCMVWHYHRWGHLPDPSYTECANYSNPDGIYRQSIWAGDNYGGPNYDVMVTNYYPNPNG